MKKNWKTITLVVLAILIGIAIGIYSSIKKENKYFHKVELSQNNHIRNITNLSYLDTVVFVGLDVLNIKMVTIFIRPITVKSEDENFELKAHIIANNLNQGSINQYLIEINEYSKDEIISIISHELIHLKQYNSNQLKMTEEYIIWEKDTLIDNIPEYFSRPWEIEAEDEGKVLEKKIRAILYPKDN